MNNQNYYNLLFHFNTFIIKQISGLKNVLF